jgi:hypothetical protein
MFSLPLTLPAVADYVTTYYYIGKFYPFQKIPAGKNKNIPQYGS